MSDDIRERENARVLSLMKSGHDLSMVDREATWWPFRKKIVKDLAHLIPDRQFVPVESESDHTVCKHGYEISCLDCYREKKNPG